MTSPATIYTVTVVDAADDRHGVLEEITTLDDAKKWADKVLVSRYFGVPDDQQQALAALVERINAASPDDAGEIVVTDVVLGCTVEIRTGPQQEETP
jgi:hypothetical protein